MLICETARLWLKTWNGEDTPAFALLASDPEMIRYIGDGQPWPEDRIAGFVARQQREWASDGFCFYKLVPKGGQELIGFCGLHYFGNTGQVEIGWWIRRDHWGQGLASEAAFAVLALARDQLKLKELISVCHVENLASSAIMRKLGMRFDRETTTDKLGLPINIPVYVYQITLQGEDNPTPA